MARTNLRPFAIGLSIVLVAVALQVSAFGPVAKAGAPAAGKSVPATQCYPQRSGRACSPWQIVAGANISPLGGFLNGVASISPNDVWAVGGAFDPSTQDQTTLAEHWNGTSWGAVPTPNPSPSSGTKWAALNAVAATASNDVWAVGTYNGTITPDTLIEHFDGTSWSIVPSPSVSGGTVLSSVTAITSSDAWAVGYYKMASGGGVAGQTYTLHWDGVRWATVTSPNPANTSDGFSSVAAVSSTDVWAVGNWSPVNDTSYYQALVEHWNGSSWSIFSTPTTTASQLLTGVAAESASNIWAVGDTQVPSVESALFEHWDGTQWTIVPSPSPTSAGLSSVAAVPGTTRLWATGNVVPPPTYATLIEEFTPSAGWTQVVSPGVNYPTVVDTSVTAVSATEAWSVGYTQDQFGNYGVLILRYVNTGSPPPWTGPASPPKPPSPTATPGTVIPGSRGSADAGLTRYWRRPWALR